MRIRPWLTWGSLGCAILLLLGLALRLHGLTDKSMNVDESIIVDYVQGVLNSGYPHRMVGSVDLRAYTYEFLPYPIALFQFLFGLHEGVLRFPAVLLGIATTALILHVGFTLFDRRTAFFAALIYTFSPWAICWNQDLFHPSQDQFLSFLTVYLFYRGAIESEELRSRYLYGAGIGFVLTYLTWEGHGFLLPAFLISLLAFRRRDWSWLKSWPLWVVTLAATFVVILEMCNRFTAFPLYLSIGEEMRWIKTPMMAFLHSDHDFWFFWRQVLWGENRALLTLIALAGLPLISRDRPLAYFYLYVASYLFMLTFFMEALLTHYFFALFPPLVLIAARVLTTYLSWATNLLPSGKAGWNRGIALILLLITCGGVFLNSNDTILQLYRLTYDPRNEPNFERKNYAWVDYRGLDQFIVQNANEPHLIYSGIWLKIYYGITGDYIIQRSPFIPAFYDCKLNPPRLVERGIGVPVVQTISGLEELLVNHNKLYIETHEKYINFDMDVYNFINKRSHSVFQTYDVQLFYWR
jgi:4-amino-4-deoxy-L-arabinose transferase-like glycosyltransferase